MLQALRKIRYKFDIIILATIFAISIIGHVHIDMMFYNAGLANEYTFKAIPYVLLYELLKIAIVLFAVTRIFFHLKPDKWNKKYAITALTSFLIFIGSWIFMFTFDKPGAVYFLRGFNKWVIKNVDIDAIQIWILSSEPDNYFGHIYYCDDFPSELPDFIKNINPEWINAYKSEKGRYIKLLWPHGFVEYRGIVVGPPTTETKQEELIERSNYDFEYRHLIKPGLYVVLGR